MRPISRLLQYCKQGNTYKKKNTSILGLNNHNHKKIIITKVFGQKIFEKGRQINVSPIHISF